jgi:carboxyl-terminal processing protease
MGRFGRTILALAALFTALCAGIFIGANPQTPVVGGLKDFVAPDRAEIPADQVQSLIENEYYRKVPDAKLTDGSIRGMVESLDDPFSHYFDPEQNKQFALHMKGSYSGVGMAVNQDKRGLLVTQTYPGSPARDASLKVGDVITKVNGKPIAGQSADAAVAKIKGKEGTTVTLTWATPTGKGTKLGAETTKTLTRKSIDIPVTTSRIYKEDGRKVGYVQLISFTETSGRLVADEIKKQKKKGAQQWILDLRGNGGGRLDQAVEISNLFLPDGFIVATDGRSVPRDEYKAKPSLFLTADTLVVLVDKGSASASEIVSGVMKFRDRGMIVGTRTFGKGVFQEVTELDNGGSISLTTGRYELPGKHYITKEGLKPDLTVKEDPKTGQDEQLQAAFDVLAKFPVKNAK